MKTQIGRAVAKPNDEYDIIDVPLIGEEDRTPPNHIPRSILVGIIRPRIEETFELVRSRLEASGVDKLAGGRAVVVGGACQLDGVPEVAVDRSSTRRCAPAARCGWPGLPIRPAGRRFPPRRACSPSRFNHHAVGAGATGRSGGAIEPNWADWQLD